MVPMMATADPSEIRAAVFWVLDSSEARAGAELVRYFAYRFRWDWLEDELRQRFRDRSSAGDWRATRRYEWILEAFDDDWTTSTPARC